MKNTSITPGSSKAKSKKWHDAFDASEVMNRELVAENKRLKEKFAELHKTI